MLYIPQERKCKELNKIVKVMCVRKEIPDGNSLFSAKVVYIPVDCCNKKCSKYEKCKIIKFDNIE